MAYTVLARRYRPEGFDHLAGQRGVAETLKNAIRMNRIGHAYLFTGPRGVGKTSAARIFAKALNCETGTRPDPCLVCPTCKAISRGAAGNVIEIDGASNNGVENIRDIREAANYAPLQGPYKVYIIDEVHMVTKAAFNALLKTLEEPPGHVIFVFATTEPHKIPETILSRCQRFDFGAISEDDISERLVQILKEEKVEMDDSAIHTIARYADGGMRDAQSCLDQLITYANGEKIEARHLGELFGILSDAELVDILEKARAKDFKGLLGVSDQLSGRRIRPDFVLSQLHRIIRDMIRIKHLGPADRSGSFPAGVAERAAAYAASQQDCFFLAAADLLQQARINIGRGLDPKWAIELSLLNLGHLGEMHGLSELMGIMASDKKKTSA